MKNIAKLIFLGSLALSGTGCLLAAAGAGAEAGYVASQGNRTTGEVLDDQRITAELKTLLLADKDVSGLNINVDTYKKQVTLKGVVSSAYEAKKALDIASKVSGVRDVRSQLHVN